MKYIKTIFLLLVVVLTCGCGKRDWTPAEGRETFGRWADEIREDAR